MASSLQGTPLPYLCGVGPLTTILAKLPPDTSLWVKFIRPSALERQLRSWEYTLTGVQNISWETTVDCSQVFEKNRMGGPCT